MVLVLILDAVGHHQIGVLRWHDRLQGAWAFVIRHWDCHGSRATELYWVLVHTLFKRIIREELYYLAVSTSKSTSTLSSTPVHPYHRHLDPVVSLALRGKKKRTLVSTCRNVLKPAQASTCQRRRPPHSWECPTRPTKLARVASRTTTRV